MIAVRDVEEEDARATSSSVGVGEAKTQVAAAKAAIAVKDFMMGTDLETVGKLDGRGVKWSIEKVVNEGWKSQESERRIKEGFQLEVVIEKRAATTNDCSQEDGWKRIQMSKELDTRDRKEQERE